MARLRGHSNRHTLVSYTFSASAEILGTGTTHIPFVSPRAPFSTSFAAPTILRRFTTLSMIGMSTANPGTTINGGTSHGSAEASRFSSGVTQRASSVGPPSTSRAPFGAPRTTTRPVSVASHQPTPAPAGPSSRTSAPATSSNPIVPDNEAAVSRATRLSTLIQRESVTSPGSTSIRSTRAGFSRSQSVPPVNFGDFLPPRQRLQRSASVRPSREEPAGSASAHASSAALAAHRTLSTSSEVDELEDLDELDEQEVFDPMTATRYTRACQKSDKEKLLAANYKGKAPQEGHQTAWFESCADEPRESPPDLTLRADLEIGDLFYHKSRKGIQIWWWTEGSDQGLYWKPMLLGHKREEDGRFLALTPSHHPTWNGKAWFRKKDRTNGQPRVFILKQ